MREAWQVHGAPGQTRTDTPVKASDFESDASTNSTTGALLKRGGNILSSKMGSSGFT